MKYLIPILAPAMLALVLAACDTDPGASSTEPMDESLTLSKQTKYGICHWSEEDQVYIPINVAEPAVASHFANHGDFYSYNDSCECPCFDYDDLTYAASIADSWSCSTNNTSARARVGFRTPPNPPYGFDLVFQAQQSPPSCAYVGDGGSQSGFAVELADMCIDLVLNWCE